MFFNEICIRNYERKIIKTNFKKPLNQIVSNVTANAVTDTNIIKKLLIEQIFSTVKWRESIIYMSSMGEQNFIEIGPGKVLSGMVKRTISNSNCFSINSITDIESLQNEFKNKSINNRCNRRYRQKSCEKFNDLGSTIIATGTNDEKLNTLKKFSKIKYNKI